MITTDCCGLLLIATAINSDCLLDKVSRSISSCLVDVVPEPFIAYIHITQSSEDFICTYIVIVGYKFLQCGDFLLCFLCIRARCFISPN